MHLYNYLLVLCCAVLETAMGHGRMNQPPGRATMWRFGFQNPPNYNDNEVYCGGLNNLWENNNGKCGVCGDPYQQAQPRDHEAGGKYGNGIIVGNYKQGQIITVEIEITANHRGHFEFSICATNNAKTIATESCMERVRLANGQLTYPLLQNERTILIDVQLPASLSCSICVFRWKYIAAQNVGMGERQEHFYSCADVSISPTNLPATIRPATNRPTTTTTTTTRPTPQPTRPTTTRPTPRPTSTRWPLPPATVKPPTKACSKACIYYCTNFKLCNLPDCKGCVI